MTWELQYKDGKLVELMDVAKDFRGNAWIVTGNRPPNNLSSKGRVFVVEVNCENSFSASLEFFPAVFGMKWVEKP